MHPTLIRANIALFTGDYAEVRRLLADYRADGGGAAEYAPMALWLDAHAQADSAERLRRLEGLLTVVPPDNHYARMAEEILEQEKPAPAASVNRFRPILLIPAAVALFVVGLLLVTVFNRPPETPVIPTAAPTISPTAAPLPDRSRPLTSDIYSATYTGGILQVTATEDGAMRVVSRDGVQMQPIPGARFYAVELAFECRAATNCYNPPEADVMLRLADQSLIPPHESAYIQNQGRLMQVSLGVTTRGWMVFEIPSIIAVSQLEVTAPDAEGSPKTITIPLN